MSYEKVTDVPTQVRFVIEEGALGYRSKNIPIWCPGCGDFAIATALYKTFNKLAIEPKDVVISSGIGCSGRFPGFFKCYGLHGVHGRAVPIATGAKLGNPELTVLAVGGDGDGLGIGGGHIPHAARMNVDITYILIDNSIYGLTKGQVSPTSSQGTVSKTTPYGNPALPLNPILLALSYRSSFVACGFSKRPHELEDIFVHALNHRGFSFVQVLSPCVVFNTTETYDYYEEKSQPLAEDYDVGDIRKAYDVAMDEKIYTGVIYREERPPLHEFLAKSITG